MDRGLGARRGDLARGDRGKAIGLMQSGWAIGYILAALLAALILPAYGWRPLFVVGVLPALFALWIRWSVPEPEAWLARRGGTDRTVSLGALGRSPLLGRTAAATAMATALLFAYWGLFTWVPVRLVGLVASLGSGIGLAFLRDAVDPSVKGPLELARIARLPILTAIPYAETRDELNARRRLTKAVVAATTILTVAFLFAVHFFLKPLPELWASAVRRLTLW